MRQSIKLLQAIDKSKQSVRRANIFTKGVLMLDKSKSTHEAKC